ncbi:AraC family transcriptional regulator [Pseudomonas juntendi]|uniref:AraC family transcriptional regulator n=1 Tax=Pseudomonas juntendi TaxID=2666183 RepID=UPI001F196AA8|nr:AraC family transcriptional regulator [Pseudomonas juntendi]MCO7055717.1 AraC family transcriptional regulator [Pseudomonas juntendi]UJM10279.1 AraC family transcriptional regulator [Pseudomonas juntendi]UXA41117.1 AraC family transcriptional regulator [Pseudomonas juntendi]
MKAVSATTSERSTTTGSFIRALALSKFTEFASNEGLRPAAMLRLLSLPADVEQSPQQILAYQRYCSLLDLCAQHAEHALFGLRFGMHQGLAVFGDMLYLIGSSQSVGEALLELKDNYAVFNGAVSMELLPARELVCLEFSTPGQYGPGQFQAAELMCAVALKLLRAMIGDEWQPDHVAFTHAPLGCEQDYKSILGSRPMFSSSYTGLVFPRDVLSLPLNAKDTALHQLLEKHIGRMERLSSAALPGSIKQLLRHLLPSGRATVDKAASWMVMNPRSLQRQLFAEGTSFQQLLDEVRQEIAQHYLNDPAISMSRLATLLGYADSSGFSRAFHRWFGLTPLQWQRKTGLARQPRLLRDRKNYNGLAAAE